MSTTNGATVTKSKKSQVSEDVAAQLEELARLREENAKLAGTVARLSKPRSRNGSEWRGYAMTGLIRFLASKGWEPRDIVKALGMAGLWASGSTYATQCGCIKFPEGHKEYREIPEVDDETYKILEAFVDGPDDPSEVDWASKKE